MMKIRLMRVVASCFALLAGTGFVTQPVTVASPAAGPATVSVSSVAWTNTNVIAIAAGQGSNAGHTCAIQGTSSSATSGTVFCWGKGDLGQLGNGQTVDSSTAVEVTPNAGFANTAVTAITAGQHHVCAVEGGQVWCWGYGGQGQLGNNGNVSSDLPVKVSPAGGFLNDGSGSGVTSLVAAYRHTCAIEAGLAYCWGSNGQKELGDGQTAASSVPVAVSTATTPVISSFASITGGEAFSCAVATTTGESDAVRCWGSDNFQQMGNGSGTTAHIAPTLVNAFPSSVANSQVFALDAGASHVCAVKSNAIYCWGDSSNGRLGDNSAGTGEDPVAVVASAFAGTPSVDAISLGGGHSCAIESGKLYCWGWNGQGQVGDASSSDRSAPVAVATSVSTGFTNTGTGTGVVTAVSAGNEHTCAVENAVAYCWGNGANGRLGTNATTASDRPVKVYSAPVAAVPGTASISSVMAGSSGTLNVTITQPADGGSIITGYDYTVDGGSNFTNVPRPAARNGTYFDITVSGLTDGTQYSVQVRAVNANGPGPWSASVAGTPGSVGSGPSPSPSPPGADPVQGAAATATRTSAGVVVSFTGIPDQMESVWVKVGPKSDSLGIGGSSIYDWVKYGSAPGQETLPTVSNGAFSVTIAEMKTMDYSNGPPQAGTEAFSASGEYHVVFQVMGDVTSGYPNGWEFMNGSSASDTLSVTGSGGSSSSDSSSSDSSSSDSSSTTAPASGGSSATPQAPSLVTSANQEQVAAPAGSAKLLVNGELVEVDLVQAPAELRQTNAGARTFAEVRALQVLAQEMVAAVQAVLGEGVTLPITVTNTSTGATITGVVSDPVSGEPLAVPVEDVLLIVNESIALMVGGADGTGDPANIAFDGVLEFGEGGYVAVLAYGLTPGAAGEVVVMSTPRLLDTFAVGTDGGVAVQTQIPTDLEAGDHTVVVAIDGQSASLGFRVLAPGILPSTGSESTPLPWAVLVLAAGAFAVLTVTRRRTVI